MENPVIDLKGLNKSYGSHKAVDNLNLAIPKGEIFGLLGPNGAGKTTTILMMLGLVEPTSGKAIVCGYDATIHPIPVKKKVGYMPDSLGFYDNMTALENLVYSAKLNGIGDADAKERAENLMSAIGLESATHKKTSTFSRGMKQRLGLAEVLIKKPEVIILDEPTLGIDPAGVKDFLALIRQLSREQGLTVLLSSHHLHQVQQVCDRVGIFAQGKLQMVGDMTNLSKDLFGEDIFSVTVETSGPVGESWQYTGDLLKLGGIQQVNANGSKIEIRCVTDCTPEIVRFFVAKNVDVMGVQKKEFGLDDIYQKYFEKDLTVKVTNEKSRGIFQRYFGKK